MKKFLVITLAALSLNVMAHGPHGHWRHDSGRGWSWVAPAVIGGVIGYEISRQNPPQTVIIQQPPPFVIPPTVVTEQVCSPWTQIMNPDGTTTYTRTCQR